jgi:transcription initiation factor TFIID subunit 6
MSIPNVQGAARSTLCSLTEQHIAQLVREAVQVQRHCKRSRIILPSEDVNKAGSIAAAKDNKNNSMGALKQRLHADDINMALQWRGSEKIYATGTVGLHKSSIAKRGEDTKIVLKDYLNSEMDLKPPNEIGLTVHWLAVDGVQPDIPQNPVSNKNKRKAIVHRIEDIDEEEFGDGTTGEGVQVTQLLPRLLSEELQLYFSRISSAMERGGKTPVERQQQDASLLSLARDPGLQELVPFLVNYVTKNLYKYVGNPEHCRTLVRMAHSLLVNPHLHLELYVRDLLNKHENQIWNLLSHLTYCII